MRQVTIMGGAVAGLVALVACAPMPLGSRAAEDFATYCAGCHGTNGTGLAGSAAPALTRLAADNGGAFPRLRVMGKVYGYTMGRSASVMPEFGPLLEGESIPYDAGDGKVTPTPRRLVELAHYLEGLQR